MDKPEGPMNEDSYIKFINCMQEQIKVIHYSE